MKKGTQGEFSPRSGDLQPGEMPRFVQVGDRQVPIIPVSVLRLARHRRMHSRESRVRTVQFPGDFLSRNPWFFWSTFQDCPITA